MSGDDLTAGDLLRSIRARLVAGVLTRAQADIEAEHVRFGHDSCDAGALWQSMTLCALPMSDAGVSAEGWAFVDTVFHVDGAVIPSTFTDDAWEDLPKRDPYDMR